MAKQGNISLPIYAIMYSFKFLCVCVRAMPRQVIGVILVMSISKIRG